MPELQRMKLSLWILACKAPYEWLLLSTRTSLGQVPEAFPHRTTPLCPTPPQPCVLAVSGTYQACFNHYILYLFIFGCAGSSLLLGLFSTCDKQGQLSNCIGWASHCGGFSLWSTDSRVRELQFLCLVGSVVLTPGL